MTYYVYKAQTFPCYNIIIEYIHLLHSMIFFRTLVLTMSQQYMDNSTDSRVSPTTFGPVVLVCNYGTLIVSIIIIICEIGALGVLRKCKRMPYCSRVLSSCFILSDAAGALVFTIHQIIIFVFGINNDMTHTSRTLVVATMLSVSWASVAAMSIERAVALKANIKYTMGFIKTRLHLMASLLWLVHVLLAVVVIAVGFKQHCDWKIVGCDVWEASKVTRLFMMTLLVVYQIALAISYVIIYRIAARHAREIAAIRTAAFGKNINVPDGVSERQFSTTQAIIKIVLAFMLLHAPIIIHLIVVESDQSFLNEMLRRVLYAFSYLCIQFNSFISLRLYVVKFDECKLHFYQFLSRLFKSYERKTEELRIKVFSIVVSSDVERTRRTSKV